MQLKIVREDEVDPQMLGLTLAVKRCLSYSEQVIRSFRCADTQALFETGKCKKFSGFANIAVRKLVQLDAAETLGFLRSPPGNHLEALTGRRKEQHSIRVNDQFLCASAGPRPGQRTWKLWTIIEDQSDV